jgi:hypothetical protein
MQNGARCQRPAGINRGRCALPFCGIGAVAGEYPPWRARKDRLCAVRSLRARPARPRLNAVKVRKLRNLNVLRTTILWIHALSGAGWVGGCVCFVLAASVLTAGSTEWRDFALKATPMVNRIGLALAALLGLTGMVNLYFAGKARGYVFSNAFVTILGVKIVLYAAMLFALASSWRAETAMCRALEDAGAGANAAAQVRRLAWLYALTAGLGAIAMVLGLWLMGT